ncbi:MAG: hypothetical protein J2P57_01485 [Acidimicrobiaceae bacterium]|nr:hypothetical protein [Acidimicrobiaceae bacterium]
MARQPRRVVAAVAAVALLLTVCGTLGRPSSAQRHLVDRGYLAAAFGARSPSSWPPPDCLPQPTRQLQIGVIATFSARFSISHEVSSSIDGQICGIGTLASPPPGACPPPGPTRQSVALEFSVPADGQIFRVNSVDITIVPRVTPHIPNVKVITHPIVALVCVSYAPPGPIHLSVIVPVTASASFFGTHCTLAPVVPLAGPLYGPLGNFTAILGGAFSIPAALPNPTCSPALTAALDGLLGFPSPPGSATLDLTVHGEAYCAVLQNQQLCLLG